MKPILLASQMREVDAEAIQTLGIPGAALMESAGREVVRHLGYEGKGRDALVVAGPGNNGGDGFVVARTLAAEGFTVNVYALGEPSGDAKIYRDVWVAMGHSVQALAPTSAFVASLARASVVVDALFGTGLARAIEGELAEVIELLNEYSGDLVSVDMASGIDSDTGEVLGAAVSPKRTVSLTAHKAAQVTEPGRSRIGSCVVADIGIPKSLVEKRATAWVVETSDVVETLSDAKDVGHKHDRGHVMVLAGPPAKAGASIMAGKAAMRTGAGLVTMLVKEPTTGLPLELMQACLAGEPIETLVEGANCLVVGPGMDTSAQGRRILCELLTSYGGVGVADADALNHLANSPEEFSRAKGRWVLTPHPKEAARLLNCSSKEVQDDRFAAVRILAERTRSVVLLKGQGTLVASGEAPQVVYVNPTGNSALATAGSGDVLAGVIAALLARGREPLQAALAAAYLHGLAGEVCAAGVGTCQGLIASDLIDALPRANALLRTCTV